MDWKSVEATAIRSRANCSTPASIAQKLSKSGRAALQAVSEGRDVRYAPIGLLQFGALLGKGLVGPIIREATGLSTINELWRAEASALGDAVLLQINLMR